MASLVAFVNQYWVFCGS